MATSWPEMFAEGPLGAQSSAGLCTGQLRGESKGDPSQSPVDGQDRPAAQQVKQYTEMREPSRENVADSRSGGHHDHHPSTLFPSDLVTPEGQ